MLPKNQSDEMYEARKLARGQLTGALETYLRLFAILTEDINLYEEQTFNTPSEWLEQKIRLDRLKNVNLAISLLQSTMLLNV